MENRHLKKQFAGQLKSGEALDDWFVLSEKSLNRKKDGNPFLSITLADRTGLVKAVIWDDVTAIHEKASAGDVVHVTGDISEYRQTQQVVVRSLNPVPENAIDAADFLPRTSRDIDQMFQRLGAIRETIANPNLKSLLAAFWQDEDFIHRFKTAPAGKAMHHAYIGGLLEHTLSMALLADRVAGHYAGIDRDLLLCGAILHDIGKIEEFEYRLKIDYTDAGRLISHMAIGLSMIDARIRAIDGFPERLALLLRHLIVSHHGSREFGAMEPPKTIEAVLLHHIDDIDAKVNAIRELMQSTPPEEHWTSYHRLLERQFFKG